VRDPGWLLEASKGSTCPSTKVRSKKKSQPIVEPSLRGQSTPGFLGFLKVIYFIGGLMEITHAA
jgi:hypothetical protein